MNVADSFRILSLCSGVGMLDEAVRIARPGARAVGYVEREAFAAAILLARMADEALEPAPVWCGNLEDFRAGEWRGAVDCVTAGFPCQPWSAAGRQQGERDERWIWPAIAGIVSECGAPVIFLENVPGLIAGRGLNRCLGDLARMGFDAEWGAVSAAAVGASHLRKRIFILAIDARRGRRVLRESSELGRRLADGRNADVDGASRLSSGQRPGRERILDGDPTMADAGGGFVSVEGRRESGRNGPRPASADVLAHAAQQRERESDDEASTIARERPRESFGGRGDPLADAISGDGELDARLGAGSPEASRAGASGNAAGRGGDIFAPGPADGRWPGILAARPWLAPAIEPGVRGVADGDALVVDESRADQLRAIGNGVVALSAAAAFAILARRFDE